MKKLSIIWVVACSLMIVVSMGCGNREKVSLEDAQLMGLARQYFGQMPEPGDPTTPLARLGKKLYYEEAISASGKMSCNTCHPITSYGVDNLRVSPGHDSTPGTRNSPTTFNAWFHKFQFWDGRSPDLADQAKGPVLNPIEMGLATAEDVVQILSRMPEYRRMFAEAFPNDPNPITFDNFAIAIAAFEETLGTPDAFDDFLGGNPRALTAEQKDGLRLFISSGCIACHIGPGLGGTMMQRFGLVHGPYYEYTGSDIPDKGMEEVSKEEKDRYVFKTSALRNVEKTAPYFHDGSIESLQEAVKIMGVTQFGREFSEQEVRQIVAFFGSLTGSIPSHALQ